MRCGLLLDFRNPYRWRRGFEDLYADMLRICRTADRSGVDQVWLTEHHFVEDGYLPSPVIAASAIAAITSRIRIGTWVLLLPLYNAVRLAEDVAFVDVVSRGRIDLGVGLGYREVEFDTIGVPRTERVTRMEEGIGVLKALLDHDMSSFKGEYYAFEDTTIGIVPCQRPFPLWMGARSERAALRAADSKAHLMLAGPHSVYRAYTRRLEEIGESPDDYRLAYRLHVFPTYEDPSQIFELLLPHVKYGFDLYASWYGKASDLVRDSDSSNWNRSDPSKWIIGHPDYCVEQILQRTGGLPVSDLVALAAEPGMEASVLEEAVELLGREVVPNLANEGRGT